MLNDMGESPQSVTGTKNYVGNPDYSFIDLVGDRDIRRTRCRAEEEILVEDNILPKKLTGGKGPGAEGT